MASLLFDCGTKSAASLCRSCRGAPGVTTRLFSSTSRLMVGPESPNFIDVPRSLQPDLPTKPKVKGVLPVPREIFPRRRPDKATDTFISDATPKPSSDTLNVEPGHPQYELIEWKQKMSNIRRKNLREGILELYQRKKRTQEQKTARTNHKASQRKKVLRQPKREDERLTASSTVAVMKPLKSGILPDPGASERLAQSLANVEMKQKQKHEEIVDSIHTLYMNARDFITTEEELLAEIDRVFPETNNPEWTNDRRLGDNIWNLGAPPTVASLAGRNTSELSQWEIVQRRTKKIAEELTGGKI